MKYVAYLDDALPRPDVYAVSKMVEVSMNVDFRFC